MTSFPPNQIAVLLSGGLDSAILLGTLLDEGRSVQPIYVRSHLYWEAAELRAVERFLTALGSSRLENLVVLDQSVVDVYGAHWSVTGRHIPDANMPDESVYLPGRNMLLISKAGLWCQLHGIEELALAVLRSNPFPDASDEFFESLEQTLHLATGKPLAVLRPFAQLEKVDVMRRGQRMPLELTFSCIDPRGNLHCGACNKCGERQLAFSAADINDPTTYANGKNEKQFDATISNAAARRTETRQAAD